MDYYPARIIFSFIYRKGAILLMSLNQKVLVGMIMAVLFAGISGAFISRVHKLKQTVSANPTFDTEAAPRQLNDMNAVSDHSLNATNEAATNRTQELVSVTNDPPVDEYRRGFDDGYKAARGGKQRSRAKISPANAISQNVKPQRIVTRTRVDDMSVQYADNGRRYSNVAPSRPSFKPSHRDGLTVTGSSGAAPFRLWLGS